MRGRQWGRGEGEAGIESQRMSQGLLHMMSCCNKTKTSCCALSPKEFTQVSSLRKKRRSLDTQRSQVEKLPKRLTCSLGNFRVALIKGHLPALLPEPSPVDIIMACAILVFKAHLLAGRQDHLIIMKYIIGH